MGVRRQLDAPGGREQLGLPAKPVAVFPDPSKTTPRSSCARCSCPTARRTRATAARRSPTIPDTWFGFEQEYFLYQDGAPLGFPAGGGFPPPQGEYYTGVGYKNVGDVAREIVDTHLDLCLEAGIDHEGINAEVAKGQWEFQIFGKGSKRAADEVWIARYLLLRLCEKYGVDVNWHPSRSAWTSTGTAPACTRTSRPSTCAKSAARSTSRR